MMIGLAMIGGGLAAEPAAAEECSAKIGSSPSWGYFSCGPVYAEIDYIRIAAGSAE